jgi:hypothetical protein
MKKGWMIKHGVVPPIDCRAGVELMASMAASQVEAWNKLFPVGTSVRVYRIYQEEEKAFDSKTRSEAWVSDSYSAMVLVEEGNDDHCLTHVEPLYPKDCS